MSYLRARCKFWLSVLPGSTYLCYIINRTEKGLYYAIDLGGTYFRVLRVQLDGNCSLKIRHDVECQLIPQYLMSRTSEDLIYFIAMALKLFVDKEVDDFEQVPERNREIWIYIFIFC